MGNALREDAQQFVENVGLAYERAGLPRMAGRILGWLLVCDPPQQSAADLAAGLAASKGSISAMTRMLIQVGLIERTSLPGARRDYFHIRPNAWIDAMTRELATVALFRQLAERGLAILAAAPPEQRARLEDMRAIYAFFERELPALLEHWHEFQRNKP
jgi:DNA-binding transcriptional regulator GbsR (MarR family)